MSVLACPACLNTLWDYLLLWHHGKNKCMCCDLIFLHSVLGVFLPSLNSFVFESKSVCVCVCVCVCVSSSLSIHRPGEQVIGRFITVVTTRAMITSISASAWPGCVFVREFACVSVRVCKHSTIDLLTTDVPNVAFKQNTGAMLNICATGTFMSEQTHPFLLHVPAHSKIDPTDPQQQVTNRQRPPYTHAWLDLRVTGE